MKTPELPDSSTNLWLAIMAGAAVIFMITTLCTVIHIQRPTDVVDEETAPTDAAGNSGFAADSVSQPWASAATLVNGKKLPLPPAPTNPALLNQSHLYVTPEVAHQEAVRKQTEYLTEITQNHPTSPLAISPEDVERLKKEGSLVW